MRGSAKVGPAAAGARRLGPTSKGRACTAPDRCGALALFGIRSVAWCPTGRACSLPCSHALVIRRGRGPKPATAFRVSIVRACIRGRLMGQRAAFGCCVACCGTLVRSPGLCLTDAAWLADLAEPREPGEPAAWRRSQHEHQPMKGQSGALASSARALDLMVMMPPCERLLAGDLRHRFRAGRVRPARGSGRPPR